MDWRRSKPLHLPRGTRKAPTCPQCPQQLLQLEWPNDIKMKVKPHTMNVCSKTHTHAVETGARQSPGKLGNLSQTHTPELPGTGRQAGMRGRGGEESSSPQIFSFHPDLMCSFWIGNTCTGGQGGQGRNQRSATNKKIAFHGHFLSRSHPPPLHFIIGSGACQGGTGSSVP